MSLEFWKEAEEDYKDIPLDVFLAEEKRIMLYGDYINGSELIGYLVEFKNINKYAKFTIDCERIKGIFNLKAFTVIMDNTSMKFYNKLDGLIAMGIEVVGGYKAKVKLDN